MSDDKHDEHSHGNDEHSHRPPNRPDHGEPSGPTRPPKHRPVG